MPSHTSPERGTAAAAPTERRLKLRLYVAGRSPNSARALANLNTISQAYGPEYFDLEVVDVLVDPLRALREQVLVTPTLIKLSPPPTVQIAGDLSRQYEVLHALGLDPTSLHGATPGQDASRHPDGAE